MSHEYKSNENFLHLVELSPEKYSTQVVLEKPSIIFQLKAIYIAPPDIDIENVSVDQAGSASYQSHLPYELSDPNYSKNRDIFDPKLRKKLVNAQSLNKPRSKEKENSWTEVDGRVFVDMGNGECLVSMRKVDSRERGTSWGMTRCGKQIVKK